MSLISFLFYELILSNPDLGVVVFLVHLMSIIRILNGALQFHLNSCETILENRNDWLFSSKWFERTLRRSVVCLVVFTMFPNINVVFTSSFLMQFFNVHQFESDQCCQATTLHELRDSKSGLTTVVDCDTYVRIVVSVGVSMAFVTWRFSRFLGLPFDPTQFQVRNGYQDESVTSAQ